MLNSKDKDKDYNPRLHPRRIDRSYYFLNKLRETLEHTISKYVSPLQSQGLEVAIADLGCGSMPYRSLFLPYVSKYVGIDIPENKLADFHLDPASSHVDLEENSVDLVLSTQVLEHVSSPSSYLLEAHRICKQHGFLILSTHGYWQYHPTPTDYWRWTGVGLKKVLLDNGWNVIETVGLLGFSAASISLLGDALAAKIPPSKFQRAFSLFMQQFIPLLDSFYSEDERQENAAVYVVIAQPIDR